MEITKEKIKELLEKGKTMEDFLEAYNCFLLYLNSRDGKDRKLWEKNSFLYLYRSVNRQYIEFSIPKKSGEERKICAPKKQLKLVQKKITQILELYYKPNANCHGFVKQRSIVTNAEIHTNKTFVLNLDLEDFFPSIKTNRIIDSLIIEPFNFSTEMAKIISRIACKEGGLPQGSPMSPMISNVCCEKMDLDLKDFSKKYKLNYSRYADDLTFSGYRKIFNNTFFSELGRIIGKKHHFRIKKSKTRIQNRNNRQEVTGVVVNDKLNVNRKYIRELRALIHYHKLGKAEENALYVISGKLEFLKMIKGKDRVYRNLLIQFKSQKNGQRNN
ncbi:MAG: reverse transcriptase family protein [Cryomorphaceae bacterium]|nr:reverse transcriptase family protein [Cryomorphaceae bacterium]